MTSFSLLLLHCILLHELALHISCLYSSISNVGYSLFLVFTYSWIFSLRTLALAYLMMLQISSIVSSTSYFSKSSTSSSETTSGCNFCHLSYSSLVKQQIFHLQWCMTFQSKHEPSSAIMDFFPKKMFF